MGLLSGDTLKNIFGSVFRGIYEDGTLVEIQKVRQPNGTLRDQVTASHPVKIQLDKVTEAMRASEGYAGTDKRVLILRKGLDVEWITTDFRLRARGVEWLLTSVETDPARSHFDARAILSGTH